MPAKNSTLVEEITDREIVLTRVFDAPRELVFEAWTDPKQVVQWWGPRGFTTTIHKMDVRAGGVWEHTMHGPDGTDYPNKSVFIEVVKPERIVYSHGGGKKGAAGVSFEATWTFEAQGNKTLLTLRQVYPSAEMRDRIIKEYGAIEGGKQTLDRLGEQMARTPVVVERTFEAPVEMVWKAITNVDQMKQWYFPTLMAFKPEVGFQTQFDVQAGDKHFPHIWKVTEVVPNKKIAYDWKFGGYPGDSIVSFELSAEGSRTKLKLTHKGLEAFMPNENKDLARGNFVGGWTHFGEALAQFLEKANPASDADYAFTITRTFDAPRDLVFKAWTEGERLAQWWGPKGFTMVTSKLDLRPGGMFHYCMRSPDGQELWGKFVYREVIVPLRLVFVNSFSDAQGGTIRHFMSATWPLEVLNTLTFTEHEGKTTISMRGVPINATEIERNTFKGAFAGMQQGFGGTLDQLEAYLANTKA